VGIRVEVTQSEHEMLRIEKDCGRGATQQSEQSAEPTTDHVRSGGSLTVERENSEGTLDAAKSGGKSLENGGHYDAQSLTLSGLNHRFAKFILPCSYSPRFICFEQLRALSFAPNYPICRLECTESAPKFASDSVLFALGNHFYG
jgi:hypothetical protein